MNILYGTIAELQASANLLILSFGIAISIMLFIIIVQLGILCKSKTNTMVSTYTEYKEKTSEIISDKDDLEEEPW